MKVAILGAGPSAAYVGMACDKNNIECQFITNRFPVDFYPGAFWPRINPMEYEISASKVYIYKVGSALQYLKKQWKMIDPDWLKTTSFPTHSRHEIAFNPYELFRAFWNDHDIMMTSEDMSDENVKEKADEYDYVFMTFPTERSKKTYHDHFTAKFPILSYPVDNQINSYCIYNGEDSYAVRISQLFGFRHIEYCPGYIPTMELLGENARITYVSDLLPDTPTWDPTDVPADNVILVGRNALWDRKVLSHDAYHRTLEFFEEHL